MRAWVRRHTRHLGFILGVLLFALAIAASAVAGEPVDDKGQRDLPGVAMGWVPLFHVARASALLAAASIVLLVAWRGARGEWPTKFGNVEYAPKEVHGGDQDVGPGRPPRSPPTRRGSPAAAP